MSAMHGVLVGTAALVLAAQTVAGIAAIAKGRIARPAGRRGIPRPPFVGLRHGRQRRRPGRLRLLGPLNNAPFAHIRVPGTRVTESAS